MSNPSLASVGTKPAAGYAGNDLTPDLPTHSFQNESATDIDAGIPVVRGTATSSTNGIETCMPMAADADEVIGVSLRGALKDVAQSSQSAKYSRYETVPVKIEGRVQILIAEDVRGGDEVVIITAGAQAAATAWGSSKGGAVTTGRVAFTGWKYCGNGTYTAGSLVEIEGHSASRGRTTT